MSSKEMISRAWKALQYRASLSTDARAMLPESPAGPSWAELGEAELDVAAGGYIILLLLLLQSDSAPHEPVMT